MHVKIGSARIDERGRIHGGKAGNQTGKELSIQNWYRHSKGWRVLRCTDSSKAEKIAAAMEAACQNRNIGYDQYERSTLYNLAKSVGFDPGKVIKPCETDCSALVRVCLAYAGIMTDNFLTTDEAQKILATGYFVELKDGKYTDHSDHLRRGDILVTRTKGHTVVVLNSGDKAGTLETDPFHVAELYRSFLKRIQSGEYRPAFPGSMQTRLMMESVAQSASEMKGGETVDHSKNQPERREHHQTGGSVLPCQHAG